METPEIEKVLVLSTDHLPGDMPDYGMRSVDHDYGAIVFVPPLIEQGAAAFLPVEEGLPSWIAPVLALAREHGCLYINFDQDADVWTSLPTYER